VIRLTRPAGDLPERLADHQFCAVPRDTPTVPGGVSSPLPSAGPYYLAAHAGNAFVLRRNPNYHGPRPQRVDAIVYRTGIDVAHAARLVARGAADYVQESDPALAPATAVARAAGRRYRYTPDNWVEGLALNVHRPLFADARVRRAVAHALDRRALAAALDGGMTNPTTHVLAPKFRTPPTGYSLGPERDAAHRLAGGRRLHAVFATVADDAGQPFDPQLVEDVRTELGAIGIAVDVVPYPQSDYDDPAKLAAVRARADLTRIFGNALETHDAVGFLRSQPYLPDAARSALDRMATYAPPRRDAAAVALAARLERDAVVVGYADRVRPELFSKRVGCIVEQPEYPGLDLAAVCLRR
jgi:ABC-type transport system substrate-binding protein